MFWHLESGSLCSSAIHQFLFCPTSTGVADHSETDGSVTPFELSQSFDGVKTRDPRGKPPASGTWTVSHVTRARLEPTAVDERMIYRSVFKAHNFTVSNNENATFGSSLFAFCDVNEFSAKRPKFIFA